MVLDLSDWPDLSKIHHSLIKFWSDIAKVDGEKIEDVIFGQKSGRTSNSSWQKRTCLCFFYILAFASSLWNGWNMSWEGLFCVSLVVFYCQCLIRSCGQKYLRIHFPASKCRKDLLESVSFVFKTPKVMAAKLFFFGWEPSL